MSAQSAAHVRKVQEVQRLFLRNAGLLRGFILGLLPDHHLAEDVFQDVFLTAAAKADDFRDGSNFLAWVRAIARLKVLEHCRQAEGRAAPARPGGAGGRGRGGGRPRRRLGVPARGAGPLPQAARAAGAANPGAALFRRVPAAGAHRGAGAAGASGPFTSRCRGRGSSFRNAPGAACRCGRFSLDPGRLHDLLESYLENRLSDADRAELGRELASSRDACRAFWDCAHQHALVGELLAESRGYEMALREKGIGPPRRIGRAARRDGGGRRGRGCRDRDGMGAFRPRRPSHDHPADEPRPRRRPAGGGGGRSLRRQRRQPGSRRGGTGAVRRPRDSERRGRFCGRALPRPDAAGAGRRFDAAPRRRPAPRARSCS